VEIHKQLLRTPYTDPMSESFKKLVYVRYADDWIIGITGSKNDCVEILEKIRIFLKEELRLELSQSKTLITNANEDKALFLGTNIFRTKVQTRSGGLFGFNKRVGRSWSS
jgi:hypothetical protein